MKELLPYNRNNVESSRQLRKKMTDAGRKLWTQIRLKQPDGYQFYRHKPIGDYIVDFYCPKAGLVIEVDGGQHFTDDGKGNDRIRDDYMKNLGLTVLRFPNNDVMERILETLG